LRVLLSKRPWYIEQHVSLVTAFCPPEYLPPYKAIYCISQYKRSPSKGKILLSDILGRRRPVGSVRESYPKSGGIL
jgi:hypothetical protein